MTRILAFMVVIASTALAQIACNDDEEAPSETATATSSLSATADRPSTTSPSTTAALDPELGGDDGFLTFAVEAEAAAVAGDGAFFADRGVEADLVCAGDEVVGLCEGQPAGTTYRGIPGGIFQSDAFSLLSPTDFAAMLEEWFAGARPELNDEFGDGGVALYATSHRPANQGAEETYQTIFTAIIAGDPDALRQARALTFRFTDGRWRFTGDLVANVPQTAEAWLSGECDECYDRWDRWEP